MYGKILRRKFKDNNIHMDENEFLNHTKSFVINITKKIISTK